MNYKRLRYCLFLCAGLVLPARAQLEFANVSNTNLADLFGITCGGASNSIAGGSNYVFVAVGASSSVATWTFSNLTSGANQNLNWVTNRVATNANPYQLRAAAFGGNQFLLSGQDNVIFSSADGVNWANNGTVFANLAWAQGLAFNHGTFVMVASAPEIGWSTTATNWTPAPIAGLSFADSFRGVTAFNLTNSSSTNFAACGILGRLATSSDGGRNWATLYGHVGQLDLLGIASDGGQTLVCVGANGAILAFTNGGTLWASSSWGNNNLNAASYIGTNYLGANYGFLAVGDAGSVLMSAQGTNWTTINTNANYPALTKNANPLRGAFFATSGLFKGVGVLVGDKGTVILAGTPPPQPTNAVNATNCSTYNPGYNGPANNPALNVSLVTNSFYPLPTVTVDWYDSPTNGNLVTNNTTSFYPTNNPDLVYSNASVQYTYYAQERDLRTGFVNTNRIPVTLTIYPRPASTSVTTNTICNGESTVLTNVLTGIGPWTVYWTDGFANYTQPVNINMAGPYTNTLTIPMPGNPFNPTNEFADAATNHYYWVTQVISSNANLHVCTNWASDLTGTNLVIVDPRPSAQLVTTNTICNGESTVIQANLHGIGPWTVYWTDGFTNFVQTVIVTNGPYTDNLTLPNGVFDPANLFPNAPINHYYWVTQVISSNANLHVCTNWAGNIAGTDLVIVDPRPTSTSVTTNTICNGETTTLTNVLTGIGPWAVYWTDGFANYTQPVNINMAGPYTNTLTIPMPGNPFNPTNEFADAATNLYYWVTQVISSNANLHVCTNWASDLTGTNLVIVDPRPSAQLVTTNTICNGESTTIRANLHGIGPWTVYWTDGVESYTQAVNVAAAGPYADDLLIPTSGVFYPTNEFADAATNHYYWVTQVISSNANLHVCANWTGDIAGTNLVIVDPRPTSTSVTTNTICNGESTVLTNVLTGIGPWTVYWTDSFTNFVQSVIVTNGPYTNTLTIPWVDNPFNPTNKFADAATNHYYWVTQVVSSNANLHVCTNWASDLTGTNLIIVDPVLTYAPLSTGDQYSCAEVSVPTILTVSVPTNFRALWFTNVTSDPVWIGTNYIATNVVLQLGTNAFYVAAKYDDPALTNACLSSYATVNLVLVSCSTNPPPTIGLHGTNGGTVHWIGNFTLQSTTNLAPPNWVDVTNGSFGTNDWSWSNGIPPINFFRLNTN